MILLRSRLASSKLVRRLGGVPSLLQMSGQSFVIFILVLAMPSC